jgi:hypothetical protein
MRLTRPNQKGFISMEAFLIIVVLVLVGGTGYFVYQATKKTNDTFSAAAKAADSSPAAKPSNKQSATGPTVSWLEESLRTMAFKYPASWTRYACSPDLVLLGPGSASAGHCNSDATAEVRLSMDAGDKRADHHLDATLYPSIQKETIKVDGVTGIKESGTLTTDREVFVGPGNGTKSVQYVFYSKGYTYVLEYDQTPDFPDVLSDFNLLVTQTVKFS